MLERISGRSSAGKQSQSGRSRAGTLGVPPRNDFPHLTCRPYYSCFIPALPLAYPTASSPGRISISYRPPHPPHHPFLKRICVVSKTQGVQHEGQAYVFLARRLRIDQSSWAGTLGVGCAAKRFPTLDVSSVLFMYYSRLAACLPDLDLVA